MMKNDEKNSKVIYLEPKEVEDCIVDADEDESNLRPSNHPGNIYASFAELPIYHRKKSITN